MKTAYPHIKQILFHCGVKYNYCSKWQCWNRKHIGRSC